MALPTEALAGRRRNLAACSGHSRARRAKASIPARRIGPEGRRAANRAAGFDPRPPDRTRAGSAAGRRFPAPKSSVIIGAPCRTPRTTAGIR